MNTAETDLTTAQAAEHATPNETARQVNIAKQQPSLPKRLNSDIATEATATPQVPKRIKTDQLPADPKAAFLFLLQQPALDKRQAAQLQKLTQRFLATSGAADWATLLSDTALSPGLIAHLPEYILQKILQTAATSYYQTLQPAVKIAMDALALLKGDTNSPQISKAKWGFLIQAALHPEKHSTSLEFVEDFCRHLATAAGMEDAQRLISLAQRRAVLLTPIAASPTQQALRHALAELLAPPDALALQQGLAVQNAGQVLAAPYIPRLFAILNLTQDGKFITAAAAERGVHLLQYMVTGQEAAQPLLLSKVLCGLSPGVAIDTGLGLTAAERDTVDQMLNSIIQHWRILGSTSVAGLRETFLQRQGSLALADEGWQLKVANGPFDMLLDHLPWQYAIIKYAWMGQPLRVFWRNSTQMAG